MNDHIMPIAIVGLSCRLPGAATDPANLWRVCAEQQDVWQPMPRERMNHEAYYHPDPGRNGTVGFSPLKNLRLLILLFSQMYGEDIFSRTAWPHLTPNSST